MILYLRSGPDDKNIPSAELQEEILRRYCAAEGIPVGSVIRSCCAEEDTIPFLERLIHVLPAEADAMIAWRCTRYSSNLHELSRICFFYEHYGIKLYSMEYALCLWEGITLLNNPYEPALNDGKSTPLPPVNNRVRK